MSVDLNTNRTSISNAWRDVVDDKTSTNWAVFGYEGLTDVLTVVGKGNNGIDEMKDELNSGKVMYAFCKVIDPKTSLNKYVLVNWQGEGAPVFRKGVCANHIRDVSNILKGTHLTVNARTEEDVDTDSITEKLSKFTASAYSFDERLDLSKDGFQKMDPAYKKVEPRKEINSEERDKFWAQEEEQEKKRQLEEIKKKQEEVLKLEQERIKREMEDAKKRELQAAEEIVIEKSHSPKKIIETSTNIFSKIEQIEKSKDTRQESSKSLKDEARELISRRTSDVRAVFEQNTSAGQLSSSRKSSAQYNEINSIRNGSQENKLNGNYKNGESLENNVISNNVESVESKTEVISKINPEENDIEVAEQNGEIYHDELLDSDLKAQALYDYQAADETEISFDPGDIISHIERIDPGWWQGLAPNGSYGLFPANYVQLLP
ncbi:drebrin-like protein [Planococcus citri]|uniref:drebrin-like protein n=1 Tax=Planococcus citri TaxID=170843 RepID=UPI0031F781C0